MTRQIEESWGSPLSGSRRFLSALCSSQWVKAAGGREGKKRRKRHNKRQ